MTNAARLMLALIAWIVPAAAKTADAANVAPIRCDDWTKVGDHAWMVKKEVMIATAPQQGQVLRDTPETKALDAKCPAKKSP